MPGRAVDEHERVARQFCQRREVGSGNQGVTARPEQAQDGRARTGLSDFIAFVSGDPNPHVGGVPGDLRD